jgi:ABC-type glycerol-3-phosphate transport system permease component
MCVLATISLFVAVGAWNSRFDTAHNASAGPKLFTLQYRLMVLPPQAPMNRSKSRADAGANGIAAVPNLMVYSFLRKCFVVGLDAGSIKK